MAAMMWLLVVMISLQCWCKVDSKECRTSSECRVKMRNDYKQNVLQPEDEEIYLDSLAIRPRKRAGTPTGKRQECRTLSNEQRNLLFSAFMWVFTTRPRLANQTGCQILLSQHRPENAPGAHLGPCFPGWHREYLTRFEKGLQQFNRNVNLCYWDSSLDAPLPEAADSALWTAEYFGNGNGSVTTGFAANQESCLTECTNNGPNLYREIKSGQNRKLISKTKIDDLLKFYSSFTELMNSKTFELIHGSVHNFLGGLMLDLNCAPLDPVFWFHHTFMDYLWEKYRQVQTSNTETDYPSDSEVPADHHYYDPMIPFQNMTCIDGLSNSYIPGIYSYAPSPSNCTTHADCGGKALWCNSGKCTAAVRSNGQMFANWTNSGCYIPNCPTGTTPQNVNNTCKCSP